MNKSKQFGNSKRSHFDYTDDAISEKSLVESVIEIQRKQSGISSIIKLFSVMVMIVAFLIGYKIYLFKQPIDQKEWIQKEINELMSQKDQKQNKNQQWYWQLFSSGSRCMKNQSDLKEIVPEVLPVLKQPPNIDDINTDKFQSLNIDDLSDLKVQSSTFDLNIGSMSNDEQKEFYKSQYHQVDSLDLLLDEEKLFNLQKQAINLKKSWQNFISKQKQYSDFKNKVENLLLEKEHCIDVVQGEQNDKIRQKEQMSLLQTDLLHFRQQKQQNEQQQEEQRKNLSEQEKEYLNKRIVVEKEIDTIQYAIKSQEKVKQKIYSLQEQIKGLQTKEINYEKQIIQLEQSVGQIDLKMSNEESLLNQLTKDVNAIIQLKTMYELKLNYQTKESQIRSFMNSLLNTDLTHEDIEKLWNQKIKQESEILKQMEDLQVTSQSISDDLKGDFINITEEQAQLKEMIDKQKNNLTDFMSKYKDLEKAIAEYKEEMLQIQHNKKKISDLSSHISNIQQKIDQLGKSLKNQQRLKNHQATEIEQLRSLKNQLSDSISKNQEVISGYGQSIENLSEKLQIKQEELKSLNKDYEPERIKLEQQVNSNLKNIKQIENNIFETNNKIQDLVYSISKAQQEKEEKKKRCFKIVQYVKIANQQIIDLVTELQQNQQKITELKNDYNQKLSSLLAQKDYYFILFNLLFIILFGI